MYYIHPPGKIIKLGQRFLENNLIPSTDSFLMYLATLYTVHQLQCSSKYNKYLDFGSLQIVLYILLSRRRYKQIQSRTGEICYTHSETLQRWLNHYTKQNLLISLLVILFF